MQRIIGTISLREGTRLRSYKKIECSDCGRITHERRQERVELALERQCISCQLIEEGRVNHADGGVESNDIHNRARPYQRRHFKSGTPAYKTWESMKERCLNPDHKSYPDYGGRGIIICQRWLESFENFWQDMGDRPDGHSIDRIDSNGHYEPSNCRWADKSTQMSNRRPYMRRTYIPPQDLERYREMSAEERTAYLKARKAVRKQKMKKEHPVRYKLRASSWWVALGLKGNPYIYGPMPYKQTALVHRRREAIERGWYVPRDKN